MGLFDYVEMQSQLAARLTAGTEDIAAATVEVGQKFEDRTADIGGMQMSGPGGSAKALTILRQSARDLDAYSDSLSAYDSMLSEVLPLLTDSLIGAAQLSPIVNDEQRTEALDLAATLDDTRRSIQGGREGTAGMRAGVDGLRAQRMSRDFSKSAGRTVRLLDSVIDKLDSFESELARGSAVLRERVEEGRQAPEDEA